MPITLPLYETASFLTRQPDAGIPGFPSVFGSLANPPTTGVAAEDAANADAVALGIIDADAQALADRYRHRDHYRDFHDSASILSS